MVIKIKNEVEACTTNEQGKVVLNKILDALSESRNAEISFENISYVTSSFVNVAFGCLLENLTLEEIKERIKIVNAKKSIGESIRSTLMLLNKGKRKLMMRVSGSLVKHLGLQMYSGAVPALAELVSNSWDAMATEVTIKIPLDRALQSSDEIIVEDNGHGMTWQECQDKYLDIGRERRRFEGEYAESFNTLPKRKVMSRKGIGKLAGFGIADRVEVRTVRDGEITHFGMSFSDIERVRTNLNEYSPESLSEDGCKTDEKPGTKIVLKDLKLRRGINSDAFYTSFRRRFAILGDPSFRVWINDHVIEKRELDFQFRFPQGSGWQVENLKGIGDVEFWFGLTKNPIKDEHAKGVVVFCRGKLAQQPWFFDIPSVGNQAYGLSYLTGEIKADFIDENPGKDLISTDRGSILWDESPATELKEWAQVKLKDVLKEWVRERTKNKEARPILQKYLGKAEALPPRQKDLYESFVKTLVNIPQLDKDEEILDELVKYGYNALTNQGFFEFVKELNNSEEKLFSELRNLMKEWTVIEVIAAAQIVKGRVEVIKLLEKMLLDGAKEVPDLHNLLSEHSWLIDPTWDKMADEITLEKLLIEKFGANELLNPELAKNRTDFICKGDNGRLFVVEIKNSDFRCTNTKEIEQLKRYVDFLRDHESQIHSSQRPRREIQGFLIAGDFSNEISREIDRISRDGMFVRRWRDLLRTAIESHKEYFKLMKNRMPNDPRIKDLEEI